MNPCGCLLWHLTITVVALVMVILKMRKLKYRESLDLPGTTQQLHHQKNGKGRGEVGRAEETRALKRLPQLEDMGGGGQAEDTEEHKIPPPLLTRHN